jgi:prepilin-type N-terminal cleavage/methylation domain-containing protein
MSPDRTDATPVERLAGQDGFTLAELLVAFAIVGLTLAAIAGIQQAALQAYVTGDKKAEVQQNARMALERIAHEIREATAVTAGAASSITLVRPGGAVVTYALNAGTLTRNGLVVIGGVVALTFAYRNVNDATLAAPVGAPATIRRVEVTIRTRTEDPNVVAGDDYDARTEITTSARPRNL